MDDDFLDTNLVGHLSLAEHFGIAIPSSEDSEKLRFLWKKGQTKHSLSGIERKLGVPNASESRLDQIYRHFRLRDL